MKQAEGDLWELGANADAIVITTNGTIKKNGDAVMGRGCAKEAALRYPDLPNFLGRRIYAHGNHVHVFSLMGAQSRLVSFPVKHQWWQKAEIPLIGRSALELIGVVDKKGWDEVFMPRPGCGNGGLSWWSVKPMLEEIFDDRFTVVTYARD